MKFFVSEYREKFLIGLETVAKFFNVDTKNGRVIPIVKRQEYRDLVDSLLKERTNEIKSRYGGTNKTVELLVIPYSHIKHPYEEVEPLLPRWATIVYERTVYPAMLEEWKDFEIRITVKEITE